MFRKNYYWSAPMWKCFHYLACNVEENNIEQIIFVKQIISLLTMIIPCLRCRQHARQYLLHTLDDVKDKNELIKYMFDFHNNVRKNNGYKVYNTKILDVYKNKTNIKSHIINVINMCNDSHTFRTKKKLLLLYNTRTTKIKSLLEKLNM